MGSIDGIRLDDYYKHFTVLVVVLVILSSLVELLLHFISQKVKQMKYRHMSDIVNCVYRELMVLGIVGALLFIANETNALEFAIGKEEESDVVVDFVHFMLFMIDITLVGAALIFVVHWSYKIWGSQEDLYDGSHVEGDISPMLWYEPISKFSEKKRCYYNVRNKFIERNELSHEFDFARYLRKCMRNKIVEMLHIDKYMWGFMLVIVLFNALRVATSGKITEAGGVSVGAVLAWCLIMVYVAIFLYCAHVFWKVLNVKPNTYFDLKTLFLFNRPELVLRAIQITTFLQSFYLSLFVLAFASEIIREYVLTCSIHNLSNKQAIEDTFKEVIKFNRHTVVGFSYSDEFEYEKQSRGSMRISSTYSFSLPPFSPSYIPPSVSSSAPLPSFHSSPSRPTSLPPPIPYKPINLRSSPLKTEGMDEEMYISFCDE